MSSSALTASQKNLRVKGKHGAIKPKQMVKSMKEDLFAHFSFVNPELPSRD